MTTATGVARHSPDVPMARLQACLQDLFAERDGACHRSHRAHAQRRLLTGLELLWKIEEQVVLPGLAAAEPGRAAAMAGGTVAMAGREIGLMRDLAMLAMHTTDADREVTMAVLDGLVALHVVRLDEMLARENAPAVDWPALRPGLQQQLDRWHAEPEGHSNVAIAETAPVLTEEAPDEVDLALR